MTEFSEWLEAWCSGYIAACDGQPNDETLVEVACEAWQQSGSEMAKREIWAYIEREAP